MFDISPLNGPELIALASSLAIYIGQNVSSDEISLLSNFFCALGDNLAIMASDS